MRKTILVTAIITLSATAASAAEYRCYTNYNGGSSFTRCRWYYTEQEIYQRNMDAGLWNLQRNSWGGTRRPSHDACAAAIETGVANDVASSYGCRE